MPLSVDQFGKALISAGLASADELQALWKTLPADAKPKNGETFAALLIERQRLTRFQAREILTDGKTPLVLGDYILLAKIGAGGMGQVFQARHRRMKRLVALKLLPNALAHDADAIARFEREVEAAAKLSHPNIVQAFDASEQRGVWYLAMEYVDGRDLAAVSAAEGPLPIGRACDYVRQAARGLAYAHENGVIHRDIKPSNLLLDRKGVIKILDMGLARFDDPAAREGLTQSGMVMGTADYMAPEQAAGAKGVDGRADTYSLGCTLYRLLTGRNVYEGETLIQRLLAHQTQPIPRLADQRPDVPAELAAIFHKMVAKRPEDRYPRLTEVEAALAAFIPLPTTPEPTAAFLNPMRSPVAGPGASPALEPTSAGVLAPIAIAAPEPTIALKAPQQSTDPVSDRSLQQVREAPPPVKQAAAVPPRRRKRWLIAAGGLGGLLVLLLGVWVIVKDKDGQEIARAQVPDGGRAEVTANPPSVLTTGSRTNGEPAIAPPLAKAPFTAAEAKAHQEAWAKYLGKKVVETLDLGQGVTLDVVLIPPGEFLMGSPESEKGGNANEKQHPVVISQPFYMAATETTQAQYEAVQGQNLCVFSEKWAKENNVEFDKNSWPVDSTNRWAVNPLAKKVGGRLPTEAEWEYACRAGTTTKYHYGDEFNKDLANVGSGQACPVGKYPPNAFGLHDMHGNVGEWCADYYAPELDDLERTDPYRAVKLESENVVRRGGDFGKSLASRRSSASRFSVQPNDRHVENGFRIVIPVSIPPTSMELTSHASTYTAELLHTLPGRTVGFVLDDKLLIDGKLHDPETGEFLRNLLPASETRELAAGPAVSQDGSRLAWIAKDGELTVWDAESRKPFWTQKFNLEADKRVGMWFSTDGRRMVTLVNEQLTLWDVAPGQSSVGWAVQLLHELSVGEGPFW